MRIGGVEGGGILAHRRAYSEHLRGRSVSVRLGFRTKHRAGKDTTLS